MEKENLYDLTSVQKSIWLTEQVYKDTGLGNISGTLKIKEKVNINLLERALNIFVQKNDSMRIQLTLKDGMVKQYVTKYTPFDIEKIDVPNEDKLKKLEDEIVCTPFNLIEDYLFKFTIICFPDDTAGFNAKVHHIISDAWSMSLLINQVMDIYQKLLSNEDIDDSINSSYIQYIESEQQYIKSEKFNKDREFWERNFECLPDLATIIPYDQKEDSVISKRESFHLNKNIYDSINKFCTNNKTSTYSFFMAIYSIYLSRVSNIEDVIIGTPVLNRSNFREKNTMGMFISNVPNKVNIIDDLSFSDFVLQVTDSQRSIFRHQKYPYEFLLEHLRKKNKTTRGLYDVLLSYQNARNDSKDNNIHYSTNWLFSKAVPDSLQIHMYDMDNTGNLNIFYDYQICKFNEKDIKNIHNRIIHMIQQVLENENIQLKDLEIVTLDEKQKLLYDFNDTKVDYEKNKAIHQLFEEQVDKTPNNVAIVFENKSLTYKELNEKANNLAHYLKDKGIKNNDIVGIMVNRSLEMMIRNYCYIKSRCSISSNRSRVSTRSNRIYFK